MGVQWVDNRYPTKLGEALVQRVYAYGIMPMLAVLVMRVEGWCVYMWPVDLPVGLARLYGEFATPENVLLHGEKILEETALTLFPGMVGPYAS